MNLKYFICYEHSLLRHLAIFRRYFDIRFSGFAVLTLYHKKVYKMVVFVLCIRESELFMKLRHVFIDSDCIFCSDLHIYYLVVD